MSTDDSPSPSPAPPPRDGEFLLRLVQNHHNNDHRHPPPLQNKLSLDPAVAAIGPTIPIPSSSHHHHHTRSDLSSIPPFSISPQNPNPNFLGFPQNWPRHHSPPPPHHSPPPPHHSTSFFTAPHQHFDRYRNQRPGIESHKGYLRNYNNAPRLGFQFDIELNKERELGFGLGAGAQNGFESNWNIDHRVGWANHGSSPDQRRECGPGTGPPPGFSGGHRRRSVSEFSGGSNANVWGELSCSPNEFSNNHSSDGVGFSSSSNSKDHVRDRRGSSRDSSNEVGLGIGLSGQLDHPGFPTGSAFHSVPIPPEEKPLLNFRSHLVDNGVNHDIDELSEQIVCSVLGENESSEKNDSTKKNHFRDKDFRSDARGKWILSQRMRNARRLIECRRDIDKLNAKFLEIYQSLIPKGEEKAKQKQLLTLLENLVCNEWPDARLFVYGSCANSFGVSKSDIDICLALDQDIINKSEVLLKLADILQSDSFQNVQALTRARVPIVKLMDPGTEISCDICINNVLAVVNTKLLRDYADIDVRLRQLAFLVKHWAKSRGVNETYQGTLSSYAYVLMCIHFLQQRNPPILPCLQGMEATYAVTVDDIRCTFFDQVEKLRDFGTRNKESIAQLLWAFFNYWAYCHDYTIFVISIRTGSILSKHEKDWTRRIGNDRHLICIEDPFETSHDLGRVVDKHSIRVLREEFERAAEIMQYDPDPCVALFDPYVP